MQNKKAFTLVELIVVITILAILGTIAFISLQGYSAQARDSKRLSDISNIKKSVELFSLNTGKYPKPDDSVTMSYSGEALWYQGTVGDQVSTNVSRNLQEKPVDPSTGNEYTYSTTYSQTEFEVLGLYESDLIGTNVGAPLVGVLQSNATTLDYPKIDGNYNGIYIKTPSFYVATPSLVNAELVSNDDLDEDMIKSQIITGGDNLPLASTGGLNVNFSYYEGTMNEDSTEAEKIAFVEAIQSAYSGTDLASDTMYAELLSRAGTGELVDFVDVVVLGRTLNTSTSNETEDNSTPLVTGDDEYTVLLMHGEDFTDSSDSNHVFTSYGHATTSENGKFGKAIYLDGSGDFLSIPDHDDWDFGSGDFTVDFWVKFLTTTGSIPLFNQRISSSDNIELHYGWPSANDFAFFLNDSDILKGNWIPNSNQWYHIAVVRNSDNWNLYVDGNSIDSTINSLTLPNKSANFNIGNLNTHYFNGYIDEFRVSKGIARTADIDDYMYDPEGDGFEVPTQEYGN